MIEIPKLTPEQKALAADILKLMKECDVESEGDQEGILAEEILEAKKREARWIINQGFEAQLTYLLSRYSGVEMKAAREKMEKLVMDNAIDGVIECAKCSQPEFKSKATPQGQIWVCRNCK